MFIIIATFKKNYAKYFKLNLLICALKLLVFPYHLIYNNL